MVSGDEREHDDAGRDQQRQLHDAGADDRDQLLGARHEHVRDGGLDDRDDHDWRRAGDHDAAGEPDDCVGRDGDAECGGDGDGAQLPVVSGDERRSTTTPVGTNSASFTTPALTIATNYWVRVTNTFGTADSTTATITIGVGPAITTQPASQTIASGATATLSVVATGTGL